MKTAISQETVINDSSYLVEQANSKAIFNQQSYCKLVGKIVKALVPACSPSVDRQYSDLSFAMLVACYESCINVAASAGAETIFIQPLGVGIKMNQTSTNGKTRFSGIWGDLFWTQAKSSLAAKLAVDRVINIIPDDVQVIFIIQNENIDDWSWAIDFS